MTLQTQKGQKPPVKAKLKIDMLIEGKQYQAGEVVELSHRDFKYLEQYDRVELAPAKAK